VSGGGHERSVETRAALVAAAIQALGEVGFVGVCAREIASRAARAEESRS
jgi:DNA-binding transcriptional regulator YbjK